MVATQVRLARGARRRGDPDRRHGGDPRGEEPRRGRDARSPRGAGVEVEVLSEQEEGRLAFIGATKTLGHPVEGDDRRRRRRRRLLGDHPRHASTDGVRDGALVQDRLRVARRGVPHQGSALGRPRSARCATTSPTSSTDVEVEQPGPGGRGRRQRHLAADAGRRGARVRDSRARGPGADRRPDRRGREAVRARPAPGADPARPACCCWRSSPSCSASRFRSARAGCARA